MATHTLTVRAKTREDAVVEAALIIEQRGGGQHVTGDPVKTDIRSVGHRDLYLWKVPVTPPMRQCSDCGRMEPISTTCMNQHRKAMVAAVGATLLADIRLVEALSDGWDQRSKAYKRLKALVGDIRDLRIELADLTEGLYQGDDLQDEAMATKETWR